MTSVRRVMVCVVAVAFVVALPVRAAEGAGEPINVVTRIAPPFVIDNGNGSFSGYSEELLQLLSVQLGRPIGTQVVASNVNDLLSRIEQGQADLGISAVSITSDRDIKVDFSQPMFASGLQVLTRAGKAHAPSVWSTVKNVVTGSGARKLALAIVALVVVFAHLIYFAERRRPGSFLEGEKYFPGVVEAGWWAFTALVAQEQSLPRRWISRVATMVWIFFGVTFVALFTATITTALTVQQIQSAINGVDDLKDKRVVTITGSTAEAYLIRNGFKPVSVSNIQDAYDQLDVDKVDGVVYDAPILQYYATHTGKGKVTTVGAVFQPENYGIVFPEGSTLRRQVDQGLLAIAEQGKIAELNKKWFNTG